MPAYLIFDTPRPESDAEAIARIEDSSEESAAKQWMSDVDDGSGNTADVWVREERSGDTLERFRVWVEVIHETRVQRVP